MVPVIINDVRYWYSFLINIIKLMIKARRVTKGIITKINNAPKPGAQGPPGDIESSMREIPHKVIYKLTMDNMFFK